MQQYLCVTVFANLSCKKFALGCWHAHCCFWVASTLVSLLFPEHWCQQCLTQKSVHSAWTVSLRTALLTVACLKGEVCQLNTYTTVYYKLLQALFSLWLWRCHEGYCKLGLKTKHFYWKDMFERHLQDRDQNSTMFMSAAATLNLIILFGSVSCKHSGL